MSNNQAIADFGAKKAIRAGVARLSSTRRA
jgi:hypothetical protein